MAKKDTAAQAATVKLIAPEGVTSASSNGNSYEVGADGTVDVLAADALNLYALGFGNAPAAGEAPAA
jgi:hypothetical protein